jgi:hypothetical protein
MTVPPQATSETACGKRWAEAQARRPPVSATVVLIADAGESLTMLAAGAVDVYADDTVTRVGLARIIHEGHVNNPGLPGQ